MELDSHRETYRDVDCKVEYKTDEGKNNKQTQRDWIRQPIKPLQLLKAESPGPDVE